MEIILIRHGESKGNETSIVQGHLDNGLSEKGLIQAAKLSEHFNNNHLNAIYSSDLTRAVQTAEPVARKFNLKIKTDPDLREASFGIWEGMTYNEVKEKYLEEYTAWHKNYLIRPFWFENFESHQKRITRAIKKVLKNHKYDERLLIFTHGGSIKTQLGFFKKLTGEELAMFAMSNCSLTLIKFNSTKKYEEGELVYYNKQVSVDRSQVAGVDLRFT